MSAGSSTVREILGYLKVVFDWVANPVWDEMATRPDTNDFRFGNPQEMPLPEIQQALAQWSVPQNKDWFAYKFNDPHAVETAVESLRRRVGIDFDPADIAMTTGAFGALAASLRSVLDPGTEVIYLSPPWFFYVPMIMAAGAEPVRVDLVPPRFELPVDAIARAITPRTRAIILNSPHNPSGRIFQPDELQRLAEVLAGAPNPIYLISDEAYHRILFDNRTFHSPLNFYDRSFLIYTYGKTLLAPGQRIGYIAISPRMPDREELRSMVMASQLAYGYLFPNALMQYAMPDLEKAIIDIDALERRRDRIVGALEEMGYEAVKPEATFYVMVRSPVTDDERFTKLLAEENVMVLPGAIFELPGWFRISLTANDSMVERSLPGFRRALESVQVTRTS
ncbi:MAG TPA: aminotransferase class I/II-fold pyridoxal phosphate-dependent enzyme [Candidatus Udaeobacter sp.]|nr:aminotransferase class I/II-fold pyridoxal phosphate-dependent enzyme [Candidatus Udaeobacter sp.]